MIKHIVLLSFKDDVTDKQIVDIFNSLDRLRGNISEIKNFLVMRNISCEIYAKSYACGFSMDFNNQDDRDKYLNHPDHIALANNIIPLTKISPVVFDYIF